MINQPWHYDKCDKVQLSASILKAATDFDLISAPDYGPIEDVAELVTQLLPGLVYEGANWDGVVWLERLESAELLSLAHLLARMLEALEDQTLEEATPTILQRWLAREGIRLRSHDLTEDL